MGCGPSKGGGGGGPRMSPQEEERQRQWEIKAQESQARLQAMMAELGIDKEKEEEVSVSDDVSLIAALQRQWYGTELDVPVDSYSLYLQATLCIASADGLDPIEASWLKARTLLLGISEIQRNRLLASDFRGDRTAAPILEKLRESSSNEIARLVYYDALTLATQDGFTLDERVRASRSATILGLSEEMRIQIEELVEKEDALRKRKINYFGDFGDAGPGGDAPSPWARRSKPGAIGQGAVDRHRRDAMQRLVYGVVLPLDPELERRYISTLIYVAGVDGLSDQEKLWMRDRYTVLGLPPQTLSAHLNDEGQPRLSRHDPIGPDDQSEDPFEGGAAARAVLLDAVTFASQDGLSKLETARSKSAAKQLGLDDALREEAIRIVEISIILQQEKVELFKGTFEIANAHGA